MERKLCGTNSQADLMACKGIHMPLGATFRPLATSALLMAGSAQAAIEVFTDEASFQAALGAFGTDSFDDLLPGEPLDGPLSRSAGFIGYSVSASPNSPILYGAGTEEDPWLSTNNEVDFITFSGFSVPVFAVGAFVFGSLENGLPFENGLTFVRVRNEGEESEVAFRSRATTSTYFGFLSTTPITSFEVKTFARRTADTWPTVNDLTLAPAIPEPGTWALMVLGLVAVGSWASRRMAP